MVDRVSNDQKPKIRIFALTQCLESQGIHPLRELLKNPIHSFQNPRFAHDFQHMIEAGPDRSAADRNARGMDEFTDFAANFRSEFF